MSTAEDRLRESFDALALPPDVKASALAAIEQARENEFAVELANESTNASAKPIVVPNENHVSAPENMVFVRYNDEQRSGVQHDETQSSATNRSQRREKRPRRRWRAPIAVAACLVAAAIGFGGYTAYATETAVVGIEINPSIELGINCFDTVVAARALNDDGEALLAEVDVVGDPYAEAIDEITSTDTFADLSKADAVIDVSVVCGDDAQARALMQTSDDAIAACGAAGSCHRASHEDHEAAAKAGMGVGRYAAAEELMALDPSVTLEDCANMTMREIADRIAELDPDNAFAEERWGAHHGEDHGAGQGAGASNSNQNADGESETGGSANGQGAGVQNGNGSGSGNDRNQDQGQGRHHGWE